MGDGIRRDDAREGGDLLRHGRMASAGGVWQGGRAPTINAAGNAYFVTGNGRWDGVSQLRQLGAQVQRQPWRGKLSLIDYFTPGNQAALNTTRTMTLADRVLRCSRGRTCFLAAARRACCSFLDSNNLGQLGPRRCTDSAERIDVNGGHVMGGPVFWSSTTLGPVVYHWGEDDVLKAYRLSGGRLGVCQPVPAQARHVTGPPRRDR